MSHTRDQLDKLRADKAALLRALKRLAAMVCDCRCDGCSKCGACEVQWARLAIAKAEGSES